MSNAELIGSALDGLSPSEKDDFRSLWLRYLANIHEGEPQLVLPEKVGQKLGIAKLREIALNYRYAFPNETQMETDVALARILVSMSASFTIMRRKLS